MKKWRLSQSMDKYKALRKMYNDAGVKIYAFKLGLSPTMSDEEYDYTFNVAEALGANHLTMEMPGKGDCRSYSRAASSMVTNCAPPSAIVRKSFSSTSMRWPRPITKGWNVYVRTPHSKWSIKYR